MNFKIDTAQISKKFIHYLKTAGIAIAVTFTVYLLMRYVGMITTVDGSSMYPTLTNADRIIVDKISYKIGNPKRYDIIVFEEDLSSSGYYIKRIIGLPGDTVHIDTEGRIYVNGKRIRDDYGYGMILNRGRAEKEVKVGKNEYFVLGDNRNNSEDSRFSAVGNVPVEKIFGKARLRLAPVQKIGYIDLYRKRLRKKN